MLYPLTSNRTISDDAITAAVDSLRSGRLTMGKQVEAFEHEFAQWVDAKHAVMVNSGSSANLLAVEALLHSKQWQAGDEILVPALAWSTTVFPIVQLGLIPVFVDIDPKTLAIDLKLASQLVTAKTRAVMAIHVLGYAANTAGMANFCDYHGLELIEDCCESFGAHFEERHVGLTATIGTFSHYFSHQLSTIEGGMLVTADNDLANDLRSMRSHGWSRGRKDRGRFETGDIDPRFLFVTTGYNVRPMEHQAAIGRVQLQRADTDLQLRDTHVGELVSAIREVPWIEVVGREVVPPVAVHKRRDRVHSWMNLPMRVKADAPLSCQETKKFLEAAGVETRPILAGNIIQHPVMRSLPYRAGPTPVADAVMHDGFMIGVHADGKQYAMDAFHKLMRATKRRKAVA